MSRVYPYLLPHRDYWAWRQSWLMMWGMVGTLVCTEFRWDKYNQHIDQLH